MAFIEPMHRNKPNITYLFSIIWAECAQQYYPKSCAIRIFFKIYAMKLGLKV